ncbi:MAG: hypothetical protein ACPIOQ_10550 [Promethearchaeia archaeon]
MHAYIEIYISEKKAARLARAKQLAGLVKDKVDAAVRAAEPSAESAAEQHNVAGDAGGQSKVDDQETRAGAGKANSRCLCLCVPVVCVHASLSLLSLLPS